MQKTLDQFSDNTAKPILEAIAKLEVNQRPHAYKN